MTYNLTGFTNSTNILDMYVAVDNSIGGLITGLFLLAVFAIMLVTLLRSNPPGESIMAASAATTIVSLFLLLTGLIGVTYVILPGLLFGFSAVGLYMKNQI